MKKVYLILAIILISFVSVALSQPQSIVYVTSFIRTLLDDSSASAARTTLGVDASGTAAGLIVTHRDAYDHNDLHDILTVTESATATITLVGQDITVDSNEAGLEAILDLQDLQGAVTDAQVPDNITASLYLDKATYDPGGDGYADPNYNDFLGAADANSYIMDVIEADPNIITDYFRFTVISPNDVFDIDTQIPIEPNLPRAITIVEVQISLDADPTTEIAWDLKFADALIGFANATVIGVCDTTNGTTDLDTGFNDATVPAGKCIYMEFDSSCDAATTWANVRIKYTYD